MQSMIYSVGNWRAEALLEELETGKLMAVISLMDEKGSTSTSSRHTVVFEHEEGQDKRKETEAVVRRLLQQRYGL
jgi:hypothetical protein